MASKTIGGRIVLEGASQYNRDLRQIGSNLKELRSEMKLANAENAGAMNTVQALAKQQSILSKQYDETAKKVDIYEKMMSSAKKAQDEAASDIAKYEKELELATKALSDMEKSGNATDEELEEQKKIVASLKTELAGANKTYDTAGQKMQTFQTSANNAKADLEGLDRELKSNQKYLEEAQHSTDGCAKSIDGFGREAQEAGEKINVFGDVLKAELASEVIINGVKKIADGIKNAAEAAFDVGTEFSASMAKVQAISGATGADLDKLKAKAKEMGATTIFSASESAQALTYMAMAGWKTSQMLDGLEGIMNLAAASGSDLATTSDIVTDALTAMGYGAKDAGRLADVMAAASSNANTNVELMGETFKYAASVAGSFGYTMEDTAEMIGLMANAGIKGTQAGTALRSIMSRLATDAGASANKLGALGTLTEDLGVKFYDATGKMRPLRDVINESRVAWAKLGDAEKASYANTIAGKNALSGWLALMSAAPADVAKLEKAIDSSNGAAAKMAKIMNDNLKGDITLMKSALEGLGISFEDCFDKSARHSVQGATDMISKLERAITNGDLGVSLSRLGDAFDELAQSVFETGADALPTIVDGLTWLVEHLGDIGTGVEATVTGLVAYKVATLGATIATEGLTVALNANPIGLLAGVIAGATVAMIGLSKATDELSFKQSEEARETERLANASQQFNERIADSTAKRKESIATIDAQATASKKLVAELFNETTSQSRRAAILNELKSLYPEINASLNEQGQIVGQTREELDKYIESSISVAKVEAAKEHLTEIAKEQFEAETQLAEIEEQLADATTDLGDAEAKVTADAQNHVDMNGQLVEVYTDLNAAVDDANEGLTDLQTQQTATQATITALGEEYERTVQYINENTTATGEYTDAQTGAQEASAGTAEAMAEMSEEMQKANEKMIDSVASTVTEFDAFFNQMKTSTEQNLGDISTNLEENAKAAQAFADALNSATSNAKYGTDESYTAIVNTLAQKGPEATALLEEFVDGAESNSERFKSVMENYSEYSKAMENVSFASQDLSLQVTESQNGVNEALALGLQTGLEILQTAQEDIQTAAQEHNEAMAELATENVETQAQAMEDAAPQLTTISKNIADGVTNITKTSLGIIGEERSTVFKGIGTNITNAMADGITEGGSVVNQAIQTVVQNAIDSINVDSISARINQKLGEAMQ